MKLLRYGEQDMEKPGVLDANGKIRDLSAIVSDISGDVLSAESLAKLAEIDLSSLPVVEGQPRLGPPVSGMKNFICIGRNYAAHAKETKAEVPTEPVVFLKSLSAICGPNDGFIIPRDSEKTDWETELAVVIGKVARSVAESEALDYVAGYMLCNDVSEREWQNERGGAWDKGKGFDNFGPIGPWLVTRDEIDDPQNLSIFLDLDGQRMQEGNTSDMVFNITQLISYCSRCFTLYPGDIIATGTPPGVGVARSPQVFLKSGQTVHFGIEGLGEQLHVTRDAD